MKVRNLVTAITILFTLGSGLKPALSVTAEVRECPEVQIMPQSNPGFVREISGDGVTHDTIEVDLRDEVSLDRDIEDKKYYAFPLNEEGKVVGNRILLRVDASTMEGKYMGSIIYFPDQKRPFRYFVGENPPEKECPSERPERLF